MCFALDKYDFAKIDPTFPTSIRDCALISEDTNMTLTTIERWEKNLSNDILVDKIRLIFHIENTVDFW